MSFHVPEQFRSPHAGPLHEINMAARGTNNGLFEWTTRLGRIRCVASDEGGWDHVSVSFEKRCPTWAEMCMIKDLFWDPEDCVVQYHPPKSEYVNFAPYCLHLWRCTMTTTPRPPMWMVGPS